MTEREEAYYEEYENREKNAAKEEKYHIAQIREGKKSIAKVPVWNDRVELIAKLRKIRRAYKKQLEQRAAAEAEALRNEVEEQSVDFFADAAVKEYV